MSIENPKIYKKIKDFKGNEKIKEILKRSLEIEKEQEQVAYSNNQIISAYSRLLEQYVDDEELMKFCREYHE